MKTEAEIRERLDALLEKLKRLPQAETARDEREVRVLVTRIAEMRWVVGE